MDRESGEGTLIGVFTTDSGLIVLVWDEVMSALTGIVSSEAVGKHLTDLVPDLADRGLLARFERVRDLGTSEVLSPAFHKFLIPCPPRTSSVHFHQMQQLVTISALRKDEEICGLVVVVEDVTDRLVRERELAELLKDPEESVRLGAAKDISEGSDPLSRDGAEAVIGSLRDRNWRVRRKLVDGLSRRMAPDAVAALLNAVRDEHLDFGLLNSALQVLQATSVDTTRTLAEFLHGDDPDLRVQAALALGEQNSISAVPDLVAALGDENANVQYHAIEALGKLKASEAVWPLLAIAETRDFFLAFPALEALVKIGGPAVAVRVLPLLEDENLREAAVETLGATGDIGAVGPIVQMLNAKQPPVSAVAAALAKLYRRHENDPSSAHFAESVRGFIRPDGVESVAAALEQVKGTAEHEIIQLAGWIADSHVIDKLVHLIENETLRSEAVKALKAQGTASIEYFVGMVESDDVEIRKAAVGALGDFEESTAVESLITTLKSDPEVAAIAARSLGRSTDPRAIDALIGLLSTDDKTLRRTAANALKAIAGADLSFRLRGLLKDGDPRTREAVVRIIGDLPTKECEEAIFDACVDPDWSVRVAAHEQLPNFSGERTVPALIAALGDGEPQVRATAARGLGRFKGESAILALRSALSDIDPWTRYFAVRSLAAINDAGSYELFKNLSEQDEAEQVRVAAAEAIAGR